MNTLESAWDLFQSGALPGPREPLAVLRDIFGHKSFRGQQEDVVAHVVGGGDAVVLFPTGAGKSLCYQVPAICRPGVGIVISPLIALMRDQVEALRQAGVAAAALNSALSAEEAADVRRRLRNGDL
ncbi:DEAD/DEAH box helicase, partial [Devosia sp.]|uniref:DEAD/DEAH box helicase n=1 Tax=Devosia sp. TaxID=1871048 RepID=UPI002AFE7944